MYNIVKLNSISPKIADIFSSDFCVSENHPDPDGILVRSFAMANYPITPSLKAVARAGAGVNNIPIPRMSENGIVVFNTPGANANAVKELVLCGLFLAARDIIGGVTWASSFDQTAVDLPKTVEKQKQAYAGTEILGKTLGIVGIGAIGRKVANCSVALGMKVLAYDPNFSGRPNTELNESVKVSTMDELLKNSDYITFHVPLIPSTRGMINKAFLKKLKTGAVILNMSRAELAIADDIKAALASKTLKKYVVDFPTSELIKVEGVISIPHLGASTEEAEDNCAVMAASQLKDFLENGNIVNSVNFPKLTIARTFEHRLSVLYKKTSLDLRTEASALLATLPSVIIHCAEKDDLGYALIDYKSVLADATKKAIAKLLTMPGVIKVNMVY
ncbi:MAG: 3-phosphoglycerate dehydrogenase [Christensenellaceae bacterium]|jgi:D-3-phosphoglycerate dehydrogenase|nr:3-phosphoglycerate dehydrogenase [Christensenellaceae bacterium]